MITKRVFYETLYKKYMITKHVFYETPYKNIVDWPSDYVEFVYPSHDNLQ